MVGSSAVRGHVLPKCFIERIGGRERESLSQ